MRLISILAGLAFGGAEFALTAVLIRRLLGGRDGRAMVLPILGKAAVYALAILTVFTVFAPEQIALGAGFGAGMLLASGFYFCLNKERK